MNESERIDELLVKVMLQEATPDEKGEVEQWLQTSEANRRYYRQFETIWQESRRLLPHNNIDEDQAWQRFKAKVDNRQQAQTIEHPARRSVSWLRIAAAMIVAIGAAMAIYLSRPSDSGPVTIASTDTPVTDTLPDGSVIHLNRNSRLTYASNFTKNPQRDVELKGEAFFDVAKNPEKPFVIQVNNATITVLGTSFNVKSTAENTEVIVETGLVEVENARQKMKVAPNEMAIIPTEDAPLVKKRKSDDLYNYYFTQTLVCLQTPLSELAEKLSEAYSRPVRIENNAIKSREINTILDLRKSLEDNLKIVGETLGIDFHSKNDTLFLK